MLSIEKYKEDLIEIACNNDSYQKTCFLWVVFCKGNGMKIPINSDATACMINWLCEEYKEPILDDVEREYLKAVIRPFRDDVEKISKDMYISNFCIHIYMKGNNSAELPLFSSDSDMYKGMEGDRLYTLEELGL